MKREVVIIVISVILILFFILVKFVYFFPTQVQVIDIEGNPIANSKVEISYLCQEAAPDVGGGNHFRRFGKREAITNKEGIAQFNSLNVKFVTNLPFFMFNCHKDIIGLKEGYCPNYGTSARTCLGSNDRSLLSKKEISELPVFYSRSISWNDKNVDLILKKIDNYQEPTQEAICKIFKDQCEKSDNLKEDILSQNYSKCTEGCMLRGGNCDIPNSVYHVYMCFTEIAIAKKDPSICNEIYYIKEGNVFINLRAGGGENAEDYTKDLRAGCYNALAIEMKNISLCANNDGSFDYCQFEVIKKMGDIEMCSQLINEDARKSCEVYLS